MTGRFVKWIAPFLAVGSLVLAAGCDGPDPGPIRFELDVANLVVSAVQFEVRASDGNALTSVAALCQGCVIFARTINESEVRGIVVHQFGITSGPLLEVTVSDRRMLDSYSGLVDEVADDKFESRDGDFTLTPVAGRVR